METNSEITSGRCVIPTQRFNSKTYYKYDGEKYFTKGTKKLHRVVWELFIGEIPKGYHIHHKDGNPDNNNISNLELIEAGKHLAMEGKRRHKENPEWSKSFHAKGVEAAKEWHKSDEGRQWHSEHGKRTWDKREYITLICEQCGKEYKTRHGGVSKYCHNNCKAKALRARRKREQTGI